MRKIFKKKRKTGTGNWIPISVSKPRPNQVVLAKLGGNISVDIHLVYVVRFKNELRFGTAISSEFNRRSALKSVPVDDLITHWMKIPE